MNKKILIFGIIILFLAGSYLIVNGNIFVSSGNQRDDYGFVYETEVDGPHECSSYEEYDKEKSVCYFECDNDEECKELEDSVNSELDSWLDESSSVSKNSEDEIENTQPVVSYRVSKNETLILKEGEDMKVYKDIWSDIAELSPNTISNKYIDSFEIFDSKNSDSIAFVDDVDENGKWRVAVNIAVYNDISLKEQKSTLIHELGHIISLNSQQIIPMKKCDWYEIDEGCATKTSYIGVFWGMFWKDQDNKNYSSKKFVTEYAASDPMEDWAETFAAFVLGNGNEALSTSIKDQKVALLYKYPELLNIRQSMRIELSRDIVRMRKLSK